MEIKIDNEQELNEWLSRNENNKDSLIPNMGMPPPGLIHEDGTPNREPIIKAWQNINTGEVFDISHSVV